MTAIRVNLAASFGALLLASAPLQLGRSEGGRPIVAMRVGNPHGTVVLVVGCIHGNEGVGIAVARHESQTPLAMRDSALLGGGGGI